ncbi:hypothetical protein Fot_11304 [Forsythia ovata]|uniref:Uncharacterized protein n=1 Tax=Forsythia ovata TaxID=205694 RepID=A0ABD1WJB4_9LAMI
MVGEEQPTEQPVQQATEHIECNWDKPAIDNVHSDYSLSDELENLNSDEDADEPRRKVREPIFNAKTDMIDPRFALGSQQGGILPPHGKSLPTSVSESSSIFPSLEDSLEMVVSLQHKTTLP